MTNPDPHFGNPSGEQYPWQDHPPASTDPQVPMSYPEYAPPPPAVPVYGYPPPYQSGAMGYRGPPGYPIYDPYQVSLPETNGLAIGSLVTSIAGVVLGVPLTLLCYLGLLIPIAGIVLGVMALNQIKRTNQQGRGVAIAGIAVGAISLVLLVVLVIVAMTLALSPLSSR
jgi:Domain of unknown function (DUF4190)